jgi:hypothetical protein
LAGLEAIEMDVEAVSSNKEFAAIRTVSIFVLAGFARDISDINEFQSRFPPDIMSPNKHLGGSARK